MKATQRYSMPSKGIKILKKTDKIIVAYTYCGYNRWVAMAKKWSWFISCCVYPDHKSKRLKNNGRLTQLCIFGHNLAHFKINKTNK
jgi:hypothetical protein